jgi:hypothetical protein
MANVASAAPPGPDGTPLPIAPRNAANVKSGPGMACAAPIATSSDTDDCEVK